MAMIEVRQSAGGDPLKFAVVVRDDAGETRHVVTMAPATYQELTAGAHSPVKCIEAAFRFLLDREAKEQILGRFDMGVIPYYYPDFQRSFPDYLSQA
ncbi:hypothetical protein [Xanthobacter versatilis]|uniref:hypothetical protein n=2 Tax=Xanthobacter autotrophicus (strain ATCC BAA-1158 / Py2) TaxID=78245 RepID=UPI0037291442